MPDQNASALFISSASLSGAQGAAAMAPVAFVAFQSDTEASDVQPRVGFAVARVLFESSTTETSTSYALSKPLRASFSMSSASSDVTVRRQLTLEDGVFLEARCTLLARLGSTNRAPTLNRVATQVYVLWGMEVSSAATINFRRSQVIEVINAALQVIYSAAKAVDYFARATMPLTFAPDQSSQVLDSSIQSLLGPVRLADSKQPLSPVETINDFHSYDDIYASAATSPRIYFLDRANAAGRDNAGLTLRIAPAPTVETALEIEYAQQAPRFVESDIMADTTVPMPHAYVESLLLPIVKHIAASDTLFKRQELRPAIAADYNRASLMLGIVDPEPTPTARPKPKPMEVSAV
jgi:hypothetical protein